MGQIVPSSRSGWRKAGLRVLMLCGAIYLLACVGCASFQRRMIYFPPVMTSSQADEIARQEQLERWQSPAGQALGWKRLSPVQPAQGRVLITHGNGGSACQLGHYADAIQAAAPLDVFIVEYPGYTDRPGKPCERSLDAAAEEALQCLDTNQPVYLVGESLGTGVACHVAGHFPERVAGMALLAPYDSLTGVAQAHMPLLPVRLMLCDRFPASDNLQRYHGPVAVFVGGQDIVVPEKFGRRLYEKYAGPKKLWRVPSADHGDLMFQPAEAWKEIIEFWKATPRS
jgi:uncharacterized protein